MSQAVFWKNRIAGLLLLAGIAAIAVIAVGCSDQQVGDNNPMPDAASTVAAATLMAQPPTDAGAVQLPTDAGAVQPSGQPSSGSTGVNGLPDVSFKQTPQEITFQGCPGEGDGGDPILNLNKNRVDEGQYQLVDFATLLNLPWPPDAERTDHDTWSQATTDQIAQAEGLPVMVEGYLAFARAQGAETANCHSTTDADFHIWLIDHPGGEADRAGSIVVEMTPRVRANHPGWTVARLLDIAKAGLPVAVSGWIMFDPEHPDQVGQTRGTIWEIHPVMQLQIYTTSGWVTLDDY
jgi:hypothetical protein